MDVFHSLVGIIYGRPSICPHDLRITVLDLLVRAESAGLAVSRSLALAALGCVMAATDTPFDVENAATILNTNPACYQKSLEELILAVQGLVVHPHFARNLSEAVASYLSIRKESYTAAIITLDDYKLARKIAKTHSLFNFPAPHIGKDITTGWIPPSPRDVIQPPLTGQITSIVYLDKSSTIFCRTGYIEHRFTDMIRGIRYLAEVEPYSISFGDSSSGCRYISIVTVN